MNTNRLFTQEEIDILIHPEAWKLVCPPHLSDCAPVEDPTHAQWMARNTHLHSHVDIMIVLKGGGTFGCHNKVYPMAPGTIFIMEPFVEHDLYYPEDLRDFKHVWVFAFRDRCVYRGLTASSVPGRLVDVTSIAVQETSVGGGALLYETGCDKLRVQSALGSIIYWVVNMGYEPSGQDGPATFQSEVMEAICQHIQDSAGRSNSLDTLASISGYSKYHFHRLFREHTGMNVHDYVDQCRSKKALQMKQEGRLKKEIASELGFSCLAAYSRWSKGQPD